MNQKEFETNEKKIIITRSCPKIMNTLQTSSKKIKQILSFAIGLNGWKKLSYKFVKNR